ncbi:MAG: gpW family head-tail joining protein [Gammaproteobacteria bacterium]
MATTYTQAHLDQLCDARLKLMAGQAVVSVQFGTRSIAYQGTNKAALDRAIAEVEAALAGRTITRCPWPGCIIKVGTAAGRGL